MKAISLWQPWAHGICAGYKRIETRHWSTAYRGPLAIHAAKMASNAVKGAWYCLSIATARQAQSEGRANPELRPAWPMLPLGCVVATCTLADCVPVARLLADGRATPMEQLWGNFSPCRFGWILENVVTLPEPVPAIGRQGLFAWNPAP